MSELEQPDNSLSGMLNQPDWNSVVQQIIAFNEHELDHSLAKIYPDHNWYSIQHKRLALLGYHLETTDQAIQCELIFAIALIKHDSDVEATFIPQQLVYLRSNGKRIDPFDHYSSFHDLELRIVREQRIEPHQYGSWSIKIFKEYILGWKQRNPTVTASHDTLFQLAEQLSQ